MTAAIKAITVRKPWSTCIASTNAGAKRVENRGAGTNHRGILLIHEGKTADVDAFADRRVAELLTPHRDAPEQPGAGAVIAVAALTDVHYAAGGDCCAPWGEIWHHGPNRVGRAVHLVLADVRPLDRPVPCRGALGLWAPPEDVVARVLWQVPAAVTR
ncbi:hypothetical protein ACGFIW_01945 [Micromonospora sp. NPDC048935]|uniref:hypothetical protein n=1 Tax=Micromonospora sp. NPDC048935 TaxID=3364262 RepID=UPI00371D17DC